MPETAPPLRPHTCVPDVINAARDYAEGRCTFEAFVDRVCVRPRTPYPQPPHQATASAPSEYQSTPAEPTQSVPGSHAPHPRRPPSEDHQAATSMTNARQGTLDAQTGTPTAGLNSTQRSLRKIRALPADPIDVLYGSPAGWTA